MSDHTIPDDCLYTREDEWVRAEDEETLVGVTDYAQDQLGDIVFLELPAAGSTLDRGEPFGVIESVKAVSDLYAPISGTVTRANDDLQENPAMVNAECYGDGWLIAIAPSEPAEMEGLMNAAEYGQYLADRKE
ncbi:MAG: glycine cleavage system protein GcvH [Myxococcota bacterium]